MPVRHTVGMFQQISSASQPSGEHHCFLTLQNPGLHVGSSTWAASRSKNHSLSAKKVIKKRIPNLIQASQNCEEDPNLESTAIASPGISLTSPHVHPTRCLEQPALHRSPKPFSTPALPQDGDFRITLGGQRGGGMEGKSGDSLFIFMTLGLRFAAHQIIFLFLSDFVHSRYR